MSTSSANPDAALPTPPSTPPQAPSPNNEDQQALLSRIDSLLTVYLSHLHNYTTSVSSLNSSLRTGYFDLTRANTAASAGGFGSRGYGGPRYGVEAFDVRAGKMESGWCVTWGCGDEKENGERVKVERREDRASETAESMDGDSLKKTYNDEETAEVEEKVAELDLQPKLEPANRSTKDQVQSQNQNQNQNLDDHQNRQSPPASTSNAAARSKSDKSKIKDPLHHLGVLVPPSLRSAQASFASVINLHVAEILNARSEMQRLEEEVRVLREELSRAGTGAEAEAEAKEAAEEVKERRSD